MNTEINKNDWKKFFETLSKRRFEWRTKIEILSPEMGDQVLSEGLPLNGVTMETVGDDVRIDISLGENTDRHLTHNIVNPKRVEFLKSDGNHLDVINIEEPNGTKTLITFIGAMELLVGIMEAELSVTAG